MSAFAHYYTSLADHRCDPSAFDKVRLLAESQVQTPFLQRLIGMDGTEDEFAACDEELNSALRMFSVGGSFRSIFLLGSPPLDFCPDQHHEACVGHFR